MSFLKDIFGGGRKAKMSREEELQREKEQDDAKYVNLINELMTMVTDMQKDDGSGALVTNDNGNFQCYDRARAIGKELYDLGRNSLDLMQKASDEVKSNVSEQAADDLSYMWDQIGFKKYKMRVGSCWKHKTKL